MLERRYLHGDYLDPEHRNPTSTVYCGFCDGYCLPEHLYDEHDLAQSMVRLNASKKAFYRTNGRGRPQDAPNYFEGTPEPA